MFYRLNLLDNRLITQQKFRTVETNAFQNFSHMFDETTVVHGFSKIDVPKMTMAIFWSRSAGETYSVSLYSSKSWIVDTTICRL